MEPRRPEVTDSSGKVVPPILSVLSSDELVVDPEDGGIVFGPFVLHESLGRGGMGIIHRAIRRSDREEVALKVVQRERVSGRGLKRFTREAEALGRVTHPNVIRVAEHGETDGVAWIAMELVRGQGLSDEVAERVRAGREVSVEEALGWLSPIAEALAFCHREGLIHRDVKPENILLGDKGARPVLIDFGLVKRDKDASAPFTDQVGTLTGSGEIVGTPAFMAPEQIIRNGDFGEVGEGVDVWGWGATMFFALTGRSPFEKQAPTPLAMYRAVAKLDPPRLRSERPDAPAWLDELVARCLTRDSRARISMSELVAALEAVPVAGPSRLGRALAGVAVAVVALLLALQLLGVFSLPTFVELEHAPLTDLESIVVRGRVEDAGRLRAWPRGRESEAAEWPIEDDGRFEARLFLQPGENRVVLALEGRVRETRRTIVIRRDSAPPVFVFESQCGPAIVLEDPLAPLVGRIADDGAVTLRINGRSVPVADDGRFSFALSDPVNAGGVWNLRLVARDAVGQTTDRALVVLTGSKARTLVRETVDELPRWDGAEAWLQDFIAADIAARLGAGWSFTGWSEIALGAAVRRLAVFRHAASGIDFHLIPGGFFKMGNDRGRRWEKPAHWVTVPGLLLAVREVSQQQWDRIGGRDARKWKGPKLPIEMVSWLDVRAWLLKAGGELRLPSEAEWEYACRAGTTSRYYWGASMDSSICWYKATSEERTHPTDTGPGDTAARPNNFGLMHMLGNVWEWCEDDWVDSYRNARKDARPRRLRSSKFKSLRGGSWFNEPDDLRVTHRYGYEQTTRFGNLGFRPARSLPP